MFGGIGPAAKAMGGYIMGLVNPYSLAAAAVLALGVAYYQGSQEQDVWNKTVISTGNAMGVTTSQLRSYAQQLDGVVGTQHAAAAGLNDMLAAGAAGGSQLRDYTQAAMAWESATGQAVSETAKQFKSLAADPLQAVLKLNESTNFLTLDLYEQIKALDEQGRSTEAARLAQDAYAGTLNERSSQIKDNLGVLEKAWNGITGAARKAWDAMLNIGRPATLEDQLSEVEKQLEVALANQSWGGTGGGAATGRVTTAYQKQVQEEIKVLKEKRWALMDQIDAQHLSAVASSENAKAVAAQAEWDKIVISNLDKKAKMERELASVREAAAAAGITGVELESQLAAVREKYAEKTKKASTATKTAYESLIVAINEKRAAVDKELSQGEKLTEFEKLRLRYQQELATRGRAFTAQQRADIEARLAAGEATERQAIAERELAKALEEDQKALERLQQQREKQLQTLEGNLKKLQLEEEAHAYAAAAGITHAEAVERLTIARLEEHLAMARQGAESQSTIDWLERELAVRKQIAQAMGQKGVREANEKMAKEAAKDWEKTSQTIGQTLSDYIMGGGKDAATYLKRLFSTLVLQPIVNWGVQGVMGALGVDSGSNASGSGSGVVGLVSNAYSAWNKISSLSSGASWVTDISSSMATTGANLWMEGFETVGSGMINLSSTMATYATAINTAASAISYAGALYAFSEERYGTAVGTAVGTYFFGPIGGAVGAWLGGFVDDYFGPNPHEHSGGVYSTKDFSREVDPAHLELWGGTQETMDKFADLWKRTQIVSDLGLTKHAGGDFTERAAKGIDTQLGNTINSLLGVYEALGQRAKSTLRDLDISAGFAVNPVSTDEDAYAYLKVFDKATGGQIFGSSHRDDDLGSDVQVAWSKFNGELAGVLINELKAADIPGWMSDTFDSLGDEITLEGFQSAVQQIVAMDFAVAQLGKSMTLFADLTDDMQTALFRGLGGLDGLTSAANAYYQSYYTEAERMQHLREQVNGALSGLGVAPLDELDAFGANAKERFRAELEHVKETGQGEIMAAMLALAPSFAAAAEYADRLSSAVDGLGDAMSDVMRSLLDERRELEAELLRAQGNSAAYKAALRAIAIDGYTESEIAAWDYNQALRDQIDALDAASEAAQEASRASYANLQAAVNREKTYWQEIASASQAAISALSSTLNLLKSNASALYGEVDAAAQLQAVQGMLYVETALSAVRSGADVTGFDGLADAISAARGGINSGNYASAFERERDALVLAGQLSELGSLADDQLTVEERALKAAQQQIEQLDQTLSYWQQQIDGTQAGIDATLSVEAAIRELQKQLAAQQAAKDAQLVAPVPAASGGISGSEFASQYGYGYGTSGYLDGVADYAGKYGGNAYYFTAGINDYQSKLTGWEDLAGRLGMGVDEAARWTSGHGLDYWQAAQDAYSAGLAPTSDMSQSEIERLLKAAGVPGYATGGFHSGGLRLVGERGMELEATGPARYWDAGTTMQMLHGGSGGGNTARLEALVERQTVCIEQLQARLSAIEANTRKTAEVLVDVTDDGNAMVFQDIETL